MHLLAGLLLTLLLHLNSMALLLRDTTCLHHDLGLLVLHRLHPMLLLCLQGSSLHLSGCCSIHLHGRYQVAHLRRTGMRHTGLLRGHRNTTSDLSGGGGGSSELVWTIRSRHVELCSTVRSLLAGTRRGGNLAILTLCTCLCRDLALSLLSLVV